MAINQSRKLIADLPLAGLIESPVEPGLPRQFWDGTKSAWSSDATVRVAAAPDPLMPEVYFVQVPSDSSRAWKDGVYRFTLLNPKNAAGQQVADQWDVTIVEGDDGYQGVPSVLIGLWGSVFKFWGARNISLNPPA